MAKDKVLPELQTLLDDLDCPLRGEGTKAAVAILLREDGSPYWQRIFQKAWVAQERWRLPKLELFLKEHPWKAARPEEVLAVAQFLNSIWGEEPNRPYRDFTYTALSAISALGSAAECAVGLLLSLTEKPARHEWPWCWPVYDLITVFAGIKGEAAFRALIEILNSGREVYFFTALDAIRCFGTAAISPLTELFHRRESARQRILFELVSILRKSSSDDPQLLGVMRTGFTDPSVYVRREAYYLARYLKAADTGDDIRQALLQETDQEALAMLHALADRRGENG